jgi:hypothetical protein
MKMVMNGEETRIWKEGKNGLFTVKTHCSAYAWRRGESSSLADIRTGTCHI